MAALSAAEREQAIQDLELQKTEAELNDAEKIKDLQDDIISNDKKTEKNNTYIRDYETKMTMPEADVEKLKLKKSKIETTNQKIAADTQKKKDQITKAEEELVSISGGIKNVTDFK